MKTHQIMTVKIVIQRKADIGNRPVGYRAMESGPGKIFKTEKWNTDMRIIPNVLNVIKDKGGLQNIGINSKTQDREK